MSGAWACTVTRLVPIGLLVDIQLGKMLQPAAARESDCEAQYLKAGFLPLVDLSELPTMFASAADFRMYEVREGDLVVAEGGDVGRAAFVPNVPDGTIIQNSLHRLRARVDTDLRFIRYCLESVQGSGWLDVLCNRTTFGHLTREKLASLLVPHRPMERQRDIANYLDAETTRIDSLIAKKELMIQLLEEEFMEQVRVRATGGMTFTDPLDVRMSEITMAGWLPVKLGQDLAFGSGTTPPAGDQRYYGEGLPWIVTGNLRDRPVAKVLGSVTEEALTECSALRVHPPGALVVAMYGATVGRLGVTTCQAAVNQACCVIHSGRRIQVGFLFYYLLSHRPVLVDRSVGAGQPNISQDILRSLRIPAPDLETQLSIVADLDDERSRVDQMTNLLDSQILLLRERRSALITAAVAGELDVGGHGS